MELGALSMRPMLISDVSLSTGERLQSVSRKIYGRCLVCTVPLARMAPAPWLAGSLRGLQRTLAQLPVLVLLLLVQLEQQQASCTPPPLHRTKTWPQRDWIGWTKPDGCGRCRQSWLLAS